MRIGSITSANSMSAMQTTATGSKDQKSKSIQNEITNVQQQMQKLSSKEDLSAHEKTNERKKLQKEISGLNTELKQYQEELRRSQKREIMAAELREDKEPEKEDKAEDRIQATEESSNAADQKNLSADKQPTAQQETVITQNSDGTVILKGALDENKTHGTDAEKKQANDPKEEVIEEKEPSNNGNDIVTNTNLSGKKIYAMVAADSSLQQTNHLGTIISKSRNGIAILKGEINEDENRGVNTERKQAELEKMEKQERRAIAFQSSLLSEANNAIQSSAETNASANDKAQANTQNMISAFNVSQEEQILQQNFYVSIR